MEKALLPFEKLPQPRITAVTVDVQLYPRETRAVTSGRYMIDNPRGVPISEVHVRGANAARLDALELAGATLKQECREFHYRIYTLATPLQPGESREVTFRTTLEERGFPNSAPLTRIVENGTFIDNTEIAPNFGMQRDAVPEGPRQAPQARPAARPAPAEARRRGGARQPATCATTATGCAPTSRSPPTPTRCRSRPGHTVSDTTTERPAHGALRARCADQALLLDAVGALRDRSATPGTARRATWRWRCTTTRRTSTTCSACSRR